MFQERLWIVLGSPRRAPRVSFAPPKTPQGTRKSAREHLGAHQGEQNRCQVASGSENIKSFLRGWCVKRHQHDFSLIFNGFAVFCKRCDSLKVPRLLAKTKVRPCAQRVESPAPWHVKKQRKTSKTEAKIDHKSSKMACRARPGGLVAQLWALEGLRASGPRRPSSLEAARASQPERPSSPRHARTPQGRQAPSGNIVIDYTEYNHLYFRGIILMVDNIFELNRGNRGNGQNCG